MRPIFARGTASGSRCARYRGERDKLVVVEIVKIR